MKTCARCFTTKPYSEFAKGPRYKDGYQSYCRTCMREYRAEKFADPAARQAERDRSNRYYRDNPEYRARHREQSNARGRERWASDPEYRKRKNRQHYAGRFAPHRVEATRLRSRIDRNTRRARESAGPGVTSAEWLQLCEQYGHRCVACGASGPLEMDHVVPLSKGGAHEIANIQPLCVPCNRRKADRAIDYRT